MPHILYHPIRLAMGSNWKTVRVFISSTFRDMQAERDHLVKVTFPRLRQWCEEHRLHLVDIDLRWGVTREEAESGKALEICLEGVDGSRPFFVCLLGSRYGWIPAEPPPEEKYRHHRDSAQKRFSVTHLEIRHAVFTPLARADGSVPPRCEQAFFYLRDPDCLPSPQSLTHLTPEQRETYRQLYFESSPEMAERLEALKEEIRARFAGEGRVSTYRGNWDASRMPGQEGTPAGRLAELSVFGKQVEEDLQRGIGQQFASHLAELAESGDPFEEEKTHHEAFAENRTQVHVPRGSVESELTRYVRGEDPRPLILSGPPGSGKSSILAHWIEREVDRATGRAKRDAGTLMVWRFVGASPASTRVAGVLGSLCEELRRRLDLVEETGPEGAKTVQPMGVPADPAEVLRKWPAFLEAAAAKAKIVVILDAVNQFERGASPRGAHWIPARLPSNVRLVLSALDHGTRNAKPDTRNSKPGEDWLRVLRGRGLLELPVPEFAEGDQRQLIRDLPSVFGKSLDEGQISLLLANPATRNPLFLTVALQELRVFGSFDHLSEAVQGLPRGAVDLEIALEALWGQVLDRLDRETGALTPGLVPKLFALLASARDGLSELELEELLAKGFAAVDPTILSGNLQVALRQVRPYLQRKQAQGTVLLDFFHGSFRQAATGKYLVGKTVAAAHHLEIADYFEAKEYWRDPVHESGSPRAVNVRKVVELPWQRLETAKLAGGSDPSSPYWDAVANLLTDWRFLEAKNQASSL